MKQFFVFETTEEITYMLESVIFGKIFKYGEEISFYPIALFFLCNVIRFFENWSRYVLTVKAFSKFES